MELKELEQLISKLKTVLNQAENILGVPPQQSLEAPQNNIEKPLDSAKREYTIVTGLWDLKRNEGLNDGRNFDEHYLKCFDEFLKMPMNLFIYVPKE